MPEWCVWLEGSRGLTAPPAPAPLPAAAQPGAASAGGSDPEVPGDSRDTCQPSRKEAKPTQRSNRGGDEESGAESCSNQRFFPIIEFVRKYISKRTGLVPNLQVPLAVRETGAQSHQCF